MHAAEAEAGSAPGRGAARRRFLGLMLGSMGVVFGDIGTSPLYVFQIALGQAARRAVGESDILGILSLMLWALIIVVTVKYVTFMMRADNRGEGGILSLMALAQDAVGRRTRVIVFLGVVGAALFYGDAIITPAISVLSAVEGLRTAPALASAVTPSVEIAISLALLVGLFLVQSRGTAKVAAWFGPICLVWFLAIAGLGLLRIPSAPRIWLSLNPLQGLGFLAHHGLVGVFVLGSVSLTITGAEALYADMGHFGRGPIRSAWLFVVFPALALNYLGQGAYAMHYLSTAGGRAADITDLDWFFVMTPEILRVPMVLLATAAGIIASQAVISGAYSLSSQAMQLGLLPRLSVRRTSATQAGQIYVPTVNLLLMIGVILLVGIFKNYDNLANAYGLAVTGTMAVTTALAAVVVRRRWKWPLWRTALVVAPLLAVDIAFLGANSLKLLSGGWVPLAIGGFVVLVITSWMRGAEVVLGKARRDRITLVDLIASLKRRPRPTVQGVAVYLTPDTEITPSALLHNLKHNQVLHRTNAIVAVRTADRPRISPQDRAEVEFLELGFLRITLTFGFMEQPKTPEALEALRLPGIAFEAADTSYFLGRRTIVGTRDRGFRKIQDRLFIALARNSADPSEVFAIPPGKVVEMGVQVSV